MKAEFIESYSMLKDMKPGDMAISKDRSQFFVCGYGKNFPEPAPGGCYQAIFDLNNLRDQYVDKLDTNQPVKILQQGDRFVITR